MINFYRIKWFIIPVLLTITFVTKAQVLDYSIGLRTGSYYGISTKLNYDEDLSFEVIMGLKNQGIKSTFMLEFNKPIDLLWARGFDWFYGFGTHFGYMRTNDLKDYFSYDNNSYATNYTVSRAGVDGIIGILYKFLEVPIELSLDTKPLIELVNVHRLRLQVFETSFTIRYKFNNLQF